MLAPPPTLPPLQRRLLQQLELSDLPAPEAADATPFAVRGLDLEKVRDALPMLLWEGLVEQPDGEAGRLALTPSGAAALSSAECDDLASRLSAVASFADTVAQGQASRRAGHALRRLAEGAWSLEQANSHVQQADRLPDLPLS